MVQMDPSKSGFVGSQVELRCIFINSNPPVKISQVTWQKLLNGTKQNVAIANPALGVSVLPPFKERVSFKQAAVRHRTPSLEDTTIVFSNLQLSDEAAYICEYTTFPAGNRENMVNLTVYGKKALTVTIPFWGLSFFVCLNPPHHLQLESKVEPKTSFYRSRFLDFVITAEEVMCSLNMVSLSACLFACLFAG